MRAVVYRQKRQLEVQRCPVPQPGAREVVLRVSHCGVCGTDLHLVMEGWGRPGSIGGHEFSGHVAALGSEVSDWRLGEAAVGGPVPGCGECPCCRAGRPGLCPVRGGGFMESFQGAFAEYVRVDESQLVRVPAAVSLREAALTEPLAVALHGITLSGVGPGERVLVTGAGPIGALTLAVLRARGVSDVVVSEPRPPRREIAAKLGAADVVEPDCLEAPRMPFATVEDPFDAVLECSGSPVAFETALAQLKPMGRLVAVGTGMQRPRLDANRVLLNELVVTGAYNYDENGFVDALELLASGRLPTELLVESRDVALEGLQDAMERLVGGSLGAKVLVAPPLQ
jgi:2-desacetyl-2-hydroxyethyl bacteriochlorophyllide A dehydrogenase